MTSTPAHVALTLDGAQDAADWSISGNAMRWTPPEPDVPPVDAPVTVAEIRQRADLGSAFDTDAAAYRISYLFGMATGAPAPRPTPKRRRWWDPRRWWR